jgi:ribonuclease P protein component
MLAKKYRLNLTLTENSQMFKSGLSQQFTGKSLLFYYRPNKTKLKIAALAPSRIFPKAYQRNRYRRLLYNLIIKKNKEMSGAGKYNLFDKKIDLIIVYKDRNFKNSDLEEDLNKFLEKYADI